MNNSYENNSNQRNFWAGEFGNSYIDRNYSTEEMNQLYKERTGFTFEQILKNFFIDIDKNSKILELGCNIGLVLSSLKKMGFANLYGLELNKKSFEIAKENNPNITFINSSMEDYDSKGEHFDLVYTSGVLIHIHPDALNAIIHKIVSLTNEYIFGFEYYSDSLVEVKYRGHSNVLWKQNFPLLFTKLYPSMTKIKEKKIYYKNEDLCDVAYLLKKSS
ncbi:MAG: methyltransferase domain-containing protein [Thaumarchaeota archaeon]|nr:methyltransferase domain-containing protein [Nitrososphaerota archaeon]MBI3641327.1 methyltransferase domain-containing protein [Nitrososphaerota archaeon]